MNKKRVSDTLGGNLFRDCLRHAIKRSVHGPL